MLVASNEYVLMHKFLGTRILFLNTARLPYLVTHAHESRLVKLVEYIDFV